MLFPCDLLKLVAIYAIIKPATGVETVKFLSPDGEIVDSLLQVSEQDVHIEDFFWTGSGDGSYPPAYRRFPVVGQSDGTPSTNTIIRTATVLATVFVNNNDDQDDTSCIFDCDDQTGSPPEKIVPEDRRFWLMTVIAGVFDPDDFPALEDKLAKLYRIAFTRQQARHLGLTKHATIPNAPDPTPTGDQSRRKRDTTQPQHIAPSKTLQLDNGHKISLKNENIFINENTAALRSEILRRRRRKTATAAHKSVHKRDTKDLLDKLKKDNLQIIVQNKTTESSNRRKAVDFQQVDVFIHNMTLMGEDGNGNLVDGDTNNVKSNATTATNQTEIIYSVFVAGKPVLATTASEDMQLLTQDEVNLVMEKLVYIKAEQPLATPLVPATANGNASLVAVFGKNTLLFIILCATIVLLVILLLGLLFTAAAKRKRDERMKRITSTQTYMRSHTPGDDIATIKSEYGFDDDEDGLDNVGYEQDTQDVMVRQSRHSAVQKMSPILNFPHPPTSRPPSCSTSSTSDSSIYYPKPDTAANAERAVTDRRQQYSNVVATRKPEVNELYSSVAKSKEVKKSNSKLAKLKPNRRKYLKTENRVGSIEHAEVHTSATPSPSDGYEKPLCLTTKIPYEHNGHEDSAQGPVISHYHRNKVIADLKFIEAPDDPANEMESPTEAINRKILQKLESKEILSPDQGSIGSYLSMGSVRSFPKCAVPEPLSRVLEPTTLTHLDQLDSDPNIDRKLKRVPTYEEKNDPLLTRSHSDGADPGVVGPIVWQIHKESLLHDKEAASLLRDPAKTRSRFENLLDGAMKFYETPPYPPPAYDENCTNNEMPGAVKVKDYRVKTAAAATIKSGQELDRPITAGALPTHTIRDSLPPTPSKGAWGSGKQSPQVRPLSAGPFHKPSAIPVVHSHPPTTPSIDVPRVLAIHNQLDANTLSAAPIINAITDELKRFNETRQNENK